MPSADQLAALHARVAAARASSDGDEALARVKLAQWVYESGWGKHAIVERDADGRVVGVNPFGIKAQGSEPGVDRETREVLSESDLNLFRASSADFHRGRRIASATRRDDGLYDVVMLDRFRIWPDEAAAFRAHTEFLTKRWASAWTRYQNARTGVVADDVANLVHTLQNLYWDGKRWRRYSTDPDYERKIRTMALSKEITEALAMPETSTEYARDYSHAEIAYNAYCAATGGVSLVSGDRLPAFADLKESIRDAWWAAAHAVRMGRTQ